MHAMTTTYVTTGKANPSSSRGTSSHENSKPNNPRITAMPMLTSRPSVPPTSVMLWMKAMQ